MAVNGGYVQQVRDLLARGANPNARYYESQGSSTVLMEAAALGSAPIVEALLAHGARVNARGYSLMLGAPRGEGDFRESTALIEACLRGDNEKVIAALLSHGADVNARDASGGDALSASVWQAEWWEAEVLLKHGAHADRALRREIAAHTATAPVTR